MHWFDSLVKRLAASGAPSKPPDEDAILTEGQRTSRRRFVQGAAASAVGVGAATYVKPGLQTLGIPVAQAAVSPGGGGGCPRVPCPPSQDPCKINVCLEGQCVLVSAANGTKCDDGDPCTVEDACQQGVCTGEPKCPGGLCSGGVCIE